MLQTSDISKSCHHSTHSVDEKQRVFGLGCSRILSLVAFIGLWSFYGGNDLAWGDVVTTDKKAIVAAGFGYQIGSVSAISVKVYEADSGAIVSDDVYELTVKEGDGAGRNEGLVFLRVVSDRGLQTSPTSSCGFTTRIPGYSNGKGDLTSYNLTERGGARSFQLESLVTLPSRESARSGRQPNSRNFVACGRRGNRLSGLGG